MPISFWIKTLFPPIPLFNGTKSITEGEQIFRVEEPKAENPPCEKPEREIPSYPSTPPTEKLS
jgi:hypothetical protein